MSRPSRAINGEKIVQLIRKVTIFGQPPTLLHHLSKKAKKEKEKKILRLFNARNGFSSFHKLLAGGDLIFMTYCTKEQNHVKTTRYERLSFWVEITELENFGIIT